MFENISFSVKMFQRFCKSMANGVAKKTRLKNKVDLLENDIDNTVDEGSQMTKNYKRLFHI